jgi:hypothetical protein
MRLPLLVVLLATVGCGQIAPVEPAKDEAPARDPAGSSPGAPPDPAPTSTPSPPPPAGACGVVAASRSFATADEQAVALHGLWVGCTTDRAPSLCPASDTSMFFGALDRQNDPTSRAAACGHVTTHGDGFIPNAAYRFTYEVTNLAAPNAPPTYALRVTNDSTDRMFVLSYRDDTATAGFLSDGTITLGEPDGWPGTLRHSAFTTF